MVRAELKKLLHSGPFRIFLCIFLAMGVISPLARKYRTDGIGNRSGDIAKGYQAYEGLSPEAVIADAEQRIRLLQIRQDFEILAQLPPDIARMHLDSMIERYGMGEEELAKLEGEALPEFTDSIPREIALLQAIRDHGSRIAGYPGYLESIRAQVDTIRNSVLYRNNPYALALAEKTAAEYVPLRGMTLPLADPTGAELALGIWVDDAILCAIICMTALFAFAQERQEGMTPLLFSTRHGQLGTYAAKLAVVMGIGVGAGCFLMAARLGIAGELGDLTRPVQTLPAYYTSPLPISVGTLLERSFLQRMAAALVVGLVMGLLCVVLDRSLALGAAALIAGVEILCWLFIDSSSVFQAFKYLSVPAMFSDETLLGNAVYIKLFGQPVPFLWGYLALTLVGGCALAVAGAHAYRRTLHVLSIPGGIRKLRRKKRSPGLFMLEVRKLLIHQKMALLLILVIAVQPGFYRSFHSGLNIRELRYLSVLTEVAGEYSPEKHEALLSERDTLQELQATAGELMQKELDQRLAAVDRVLQLSDYLATRAERVSYVYEGGIEALLGIRTIGPEYQFPLLVLSLCLILPGLFTLERETGMERLLGTTRGRRALRRSKWRIAAVLAVTLWTVCRIPAVWFVFRTFEISGWTARAISLRSLSGLPGWMPVWLVVAAVEVWRLSCAGLGAALVGVVSERVGKYIPAVLLSGCLLGVVIVLGL